MCNVHKALLKSTKIELWIEKLYFDWFLLWLFVCHSNTLRSSNVFFFIRFAKEERRWISCTNRRQNENWGNWISAFCNRANSIKMETNNRPSHSFFLPLYEMLACFDVVERIQKKKLAITEWILTSFQFLSRKEKCGTSIRLNKR